MKYLFSPQSISLNYDGATKIIDRSDSKFDAILAALREKNDDKVKLIVDGLKNAIAASNSSAFKVENGMVYIDGVQVNGLINSKIVEYVNNGLDPSSLVNFWRNLQKNPSSRAKERLFAFLENGNHPFTDDGCFIAYKKVGSDMKDTYTHTIDNSVGCKPTMDRSKVDDDPEHTCSHGLHVASWEYAQGYSGQVLIDVKVNPANVVSIPVDYNNQKMRVCEYEVIALSQGKREELHVYDQEEMEDIDDEDEDFEDEDFEDDCDDADERDDEEYEKGLSDAEALLVYFESIGSNYTFNSFLGLKRFENTSESYMEGVEEAAERHFN